MATSHDEPKDGQKVHEIAGGWITERAGTPIPVFLKIAYVGFCLFGLIYLFIYRFGEVDHATRGPLVQQLNQVADQPPAAWIVFLGVVLFTFVVGLLAFAFRSREEE
jgi:hypothetical protein